MKGTNVNAKALLEHAVAKMTPQQADDFIKDAPLAFRIGSQRYRFQNGGLVSEDGAGISASMGSITGVEMISEEDSANWGTADSTGAGGTQPEPGQEPRTSGGDLRNTSLNPNPGGPHALGPGTGASVPYDSVKMGPGEPLIPADSPEALGAKPDHIPGSTDLNVEGASMSEGGEQQQGGEQSQA
jgi:hypothetical protein